MYEVLDRHGPGSWKEVGNKLNRSSLGCRNRYEPKNMGCWDGTLISLRCGRWRMLERQKTISMQPGPSHQLPPSHEPAQHVTPDALGPWISPIPEMRFWEEHTQYGTPTVEQGGLPDLNIESPYLTSQYPSPSENSHMPELSSGTETTAPFRYSTSSSLSLALSLPTTSPSSAYLRTPPSSQYRNLSTPSTPGIDQTPSGASFMSSPQDFMTVSYAAPSNHSASFSPPEPSNTMLHVPLISVTLQSNPSHERSVSISTSLSPRSAVQAYPTPISSPLIMTPPVEALSDVSIPAQPSPGQDPNRHYRTPEQKKAAVTSTKQKTPIPRQRLTDTRQPRLSASLPATSE